MKKAPKKTRTNPFFKKLVGAMEEMNEVQVGKRKPSRVFEVHADDVKELRKRTGPRKRWG